MKDLLKYLVIVLIATLGICALFGIRGCQKKAALLDEHEALLQMQADTIRYYRDYAGREHALRKSAEASMATIKLHFGSTIDSLTKALSIKPKQIERIITAGVETSGEIRVEVDTVYLDDSSHHYYFTYSDKWLYLDGVFDGDLYVNYLFSDSIVLTEFWKRNGLLGRKQYYIDGYSLNPSTHFTGLSSVKVGKKIPGRLGIGPFVGVGWDGAKLAPTVGVSAHLSIFRF